MNTASVGWLWLGHSTGTGTGTDTPRCAAMYEQVAARRGDAVEFSGPWMLESTLVVVGESHLFPGPADPYPVPPRGQSWKEQTQLERPRKSATGGKKSFVGCINTTTTPITLSAHYTLSSFRSFPFQVPIHSPSTPLSPNRMEAGPESAASCH